MAKHKGIERIDIDARLCKGTEGCGICIDLCREGVLGSADFLSPRGVHPAAVVRLEQCTGCEWCMIYCPDMAVNVAQSKAA